MFQPPDQHFRPMRCCVTPPGWLTPDCPGPWIPPLRFASVGRKAKGLRRSTPDPPVSVLGLRKGQWQACRVIQTGRLAVIMGVPKKRKGKRERQEKYLLLIKSMSSPPDFPSNWFSVNPCLHLQETRLGSCCNPVRYWYLQFSVWSSYFFFSTRRPFPSSVSGSPVFNHSYPGVIHLSILSILQSICSISSGYRF